MDQNKVPGSVIALAIGEKMPKTMRMFLIFAAIGAIIWWISKSQKNAATPFGAGAPVAPSVPRNVGYSGLRMIPKLNQY